MKTTLVDYPKTTFSQSWEKEGVLSPQQQGWLFLSNKVDSIYYNALYGLENLGSYRYRDVQLSELLRRLSSVFSQEQDPLCFGRLVNDDFVRTAHFAFNSLSSIISNPNKELIKVEKKVSTFKSVQLTSKSFSWLAYRPGYTIQEKVSPENKVLANVTAFTADTKENEHTLAFYYRLYHNLEHRLESVSCSNCQYSSQGRPCLKLYKQMQTLLKKKRDVKQGELCETKKIKQSIPNNKLMSDKNYKMIWDGMKRLDNYDETIKTKWEQLPDRIGTLLFWYYASVLFASDSLKIEDHLVHFGSDKKVQEVESFFIGKDEIHHLDFYSFSREIKKISLRLLPSSLLIDVVSYEAKSGYIVPGQKTTSKIAISSVVNEAISHLLEEQKEEQHE